MNKQIITPKTCGQCRYAEKVGEFTLECSKWGGLCKVDDTCSYQWKIAQSKAQIKYYLGNLEANLITDY